MVLLIMKIEIIYKAIPCSEFSKDKEGVIVVDENGVDKAVVRCPNGSCSKGWISLEKEVRAFLSSGVGEYKGRVVCRGKESDKKGALECSSEVVFTALVSDIPS